MATVAVRQTYHILIVPFMINLYASKTPEDEMFRLESLSPAKHW